MAAACEVWFYHLERTALDQALPGLLEKTLGRGWRALVKTPSRERADQLDQSLWTWRDDSFLPHGLDSEPMADRQPILLTTGDANANAAHAVFLLDDAEPGSLDGYERCIILFDGRDDAAVKAARGRWKTLKDGGHPVSYWQEEDGGWQKKA